MEKKTFTYEEIKGILLKEMHSGIQYYASDLGCIVYGKWKFEIDGMKFPYSNQALALMVGRHLKKMKDENLIERKLCIDSSVWVKIS